MKGTSKVIMGATLVMVITLAVVLGLILILLAQLYCSLLLRRHRHRRHPTTQTTTTTTINNIASTSPSFDSTHAVAEPKNHEQHFSQLHQVIQIQEIAIANANANPHCIGLESFMSRAPPTMALQQDSTFDKPCNGGELHLVYISNPIYENEEGKESERNTPFETPETSPSRLERNASSSGDDDDCNVFEMSHCGVQTLLPSTPPLKKLLHHEEACSGSDSHTNNVLSSSSSVSLSTSPSW